MDWNGQENLSLSSELWAGTNDFNTKKNFLVRSHPRIIFLSGNWPLLYIGAPFARHRMIEFGTFSSTDVSSKPPYKFPAV